MSKFRYSGIIPDDIQDLLLDVRNRTTQDKLMVGRLVNAAYKGHVMAGDKYTFGDVCKAAGVFCGERAKDVREFALVAGMVDGFSKEEEAKYDVLSYAYFKRALSLGEDWKKALDWAVEQTDDLNRPASVDAVIVMVQDPNKMNSRTSATESAKAGYADLLKKTISRIQSEVMTKLDDQEIAMKVFSLLTEANHLLGGETGLTNDPREAQADEDAWDKHLGLPF